jgi:hypothetical protein
MGLVKNHYAFSKAYEGFFGKSERVFKCTWINSDNYH